MYVNSVNRGFANNVAVGSGGNYYRLRVQGLDFAGHPDAVHGRHIDASVTM